MYLMDTTLNLSTAPSNFETLTDMMKLLNSIKYDYIDLGFLIHQQSPSLEDKNKMVAASEIITDCCWGLTCLLDDDSYMEQIYEWINVARSHRLGFVQILLDHENLVDLCTELIQWCTQQHLEIFCLVRRTNHLSSHQFNRIALKCLDMNAIVGIEDDSIMLPPELYSLIDGIKELKPDARLYFKSSNQLGMAVANTACALESHISTVVTTLNHSFHIQLLCVLYRLGYFIDPAQFSLCQQFIQIFYPETWPLLEHLIHNVSTLPRCYGSTWSA